MNDRALFARRPADPRPCALYLRSDVCFDPEVDSVEALVPSLSQLSMQRRAKLVGMTLCRLPVELQLLAEARYVEGLSGPELAEAFEIPEGTVRSRLARVRQMLREVLPPSIRSGHELRRPRACREFVRTVIRF